MLRWREVHVHRKMVSREPHMISKVPRPFGELTHPSWRPEDVAFVVLAPNAFPRYMVKMVKMRKRCAIAPCAHCPPATRESGITACSGSHLLVVPTLDASIKVVKPLEDLLWALRTEPSVSKLWPAGIEAVTVLAGEVREFGGGAAGGHDIGYCGI